MSDQDQPATDPFAVAQPEPVSGNEAQAEFTEPEPTADDVLIDEAEAIDDEIEVLTSYGPFRKDRISEQE